MPEASYALKTDNFVWTVFAAVFAFGAPTAMVLLADIAWRNWDWPLDPTALVAMGAVLLGALGLLWARGGALGGIEAGLYWLGGSVAGALASGPLYSMIFGPGPMPLLGLGIDIACAVGAGLWLRRWWFERHARE